MHFSKQLWERALAGNLQRSHLHAQFITSAETQLIPTYANDTWPAMPHHLDQSSFAQSHLLQTLNMLGAAS
jgi:hypothetical protein